MNISFIGSGNVATHLAQALLVLGHNVVQIYSRNSQNAQILAQKVQAEAISQLAQLQPTDLYVIAVNDSAIAAVADQLAELNLSGAVVHTSGSTHIDSLQVVGQNYGVLYPLQTFSKAQPVDFKKVPLLLEASSQDFLDNLDQLAKQLSEQVYHYSSEQRRSLHLAAVIACNFSNYLYSVANQFLNTQGVDFDLLKPLIIETAEKIQQHAPVTVQTGPAIRQDYFILHMHEEMLSTQPELQQLYQLISAAIIKLHGTDHLA